MSLGEQTLFYLGGKELLIVPDLFTFTPLHNISSVKDPELFGPIRESGDSLILNRAKVDKNYLIKKKLESTVVNLSVYVLKNISKSNKEFGTDSFFLKEVAYLRVVRLSLGIRMLTL
jgi:hypothetical protein